MKIDIESEEFYNLMQNYRNAPLVNQDKVIEAYSGVKLHIAKFIISQILDSIYYNNEYAYKELLKMLINILEGEKE